MEQLISASFGLFYVRNIYYLQIITSENYRFYFVPIHVATAGTLIRSERLQIDIAEELPDGVILQLVTDIT